ncbi:glycosyltransferase family 4 protein [Urechidicola croceus]|uniref:Glycosyl transferase family 1 n=1 Tax=Urechidicola croceus TaxID=1850246 RepID=A0A1D8P4N3_9FLAO|nr:glycosyltransferase family 4 protein [Urechidicola croceus]AOW19518.1 glycosyl transferase family 1 [Urechidicola croceus]
MRILYIGNNLTKKTKYNSTLTTLSNLLIEEGYDVVVSSNKKNKVLRLFDMCLTVFRNRDIVDYILIDTFSTVSFYFTFFTSQLARLFKIKYIPILHGGNLPERLNKSPRMSQKIFNNSYKNVAPSNYLKTEFEKKGYNTHFIPNTIEIEQYKFKDRIDFKPKLLWVRAFDKTYNPEMAIYVLKELKKEFKNAKLCMIGPFKDNTLILTRKLVEEFNLENDVEITGVMKKENWHKKSEEFDIFINTTNFDNTPISVIEAMALGLPVVSTNIGGIPYLIENEVDGFLVDVNDVKNMTKAIIKLNNNSVEAKKMIKNARLKVEKFDWLFVKDKWKDILK